MVKGRTEASAREELIKKRLWKAVDSLRKNIDVAEYKHVVLGLIFLKFISDVFVELFIKLEAGEGEYAGADPEDKDEYRAENIFFVPFEARWSFLQSKAEQPHLGQLIDTAMYMIEKENASLKGVLPKVFASENIDPTSLRGLIDLISNITSDNTNTPITDVLPNVFENFLCEFSLAEGKKDGLFYTPRSITNLLVTMLEPCKGRVFDPCCGSGGMLVQSERFVEARQEAAAGDVLIYGQESNHATWQMAMMNVAIHGIDSSQVKWNSEGAFLKDAHEGLKADFAIANPPFNMKGWGAELLGGDYRWQYGMPLAGNANFAWIQHLIYHLAPNGRASMVSTRGSLTSRSGYEADIRAALVKDGNLVDCIVSLPAQLLHNTSIPTVLWFFDKGRDKDYIRRSEILFIDGRSLGRLINRRTRELSSENIQQISQTYHNWRTGKGPYDDVDGFCISVPLDQVAELDYVLAPENYVSSTEEGEDKQVKTATLTASIEGLEIVDQARREKGWNKSEEVWSQLALVSSSTLRRFWRRAAVRSENFINICSAVGISDWSLVREEHEIDDEQAKDKSSYFRVERSIEFPPEYWEAGTSILSYFSRVLGSKYPDRRIKVRIEQEGLRLRMLIDTPTGEREEIEKTLDQYGMVVAGKVAPEDFLDNPLEVMALKNKLEIARLEARQSKELLSYVSQNSQQRIDSLEVHVGKLHCIIERGLQSGNHVFGTISKMAEQSKPTYNLSNAKFGGGFAAEGGSQSGGSFIDLSSASNLSDAAKQIQELLQQLQEKGVSAEDAKKQTASELVKQASVNTTIKGKLTKWGQSLADTASKTTVSEAVKEAVKIALHTLGVPLL